MHPLCRQACNIMFLYQGIRRLNERPTMEQLIELKRTDGGSPVRIKERISRDIYDLGIILLHDDYGKIMEAIVGYSNGRLKSVIDEVFTRWLNTQGSQAATWKVLVVALKQVPLNTLADDIIQALKETEN